MLRKRIVAGTIAFCFSLVLLPGRSQAMPLGWMPGTDVVVKLAQWWDLVPGLRHTARPGKGPGLPTKSGCGIDPNGGCRPGDGPGTSGVTPPPSGDGSGS